MGILHTTMRATFSPSPAVYVSALLWQSSNVPRPRATTRPLSIRTTPFVHQIQLNAFADDGQTISLFEEDKMDALRNIIEIENERSGDTVYIFGFVDFCS